MIFEVPVKFHLADENFSLREHFIKVGIKVYLQKNKNRNEEFRFFCTNFEIILMVTVHPLRLAND